MEERLTTDQAVAGSSPATVASFFRQFEEFEIIFILKSPLTKKTLCMKSNSTYGITVSILAFQSRAGPGSTPGKCQFFF